MLRVVHVVEVHGGELVAELPAALGERHGNVDRCILGVVAYGLRDGAAVKALGGGGALRRSLGGIFYGGLCRGALRLCA